MGPYRFLRYVVDRTVLTLTSYNFVNREKWERASCWTCNWHMQENCECLFLDLETEGRNGQFQGWAKPASSQPHHRHAKQGGGLDNKRLSGCLKRRSFTIPEGRQENQAPGTYLAGHWCLRICEQDLQSPDEFHRCAVLWRACHCIYSYLKPGLHLLNNTVLPPDENDTDLTKDAKRAILQYFYEKYSDPASDGPWPSFVNPRFKLS